MLQVLGHGGYLVIDGVALFSHVGTTGANPEYRLVRFERRGEWLYMIGGPTGSESMHPDDFERRGEWLYMIGGPTGYESMLPDDREDGWMACEGTEGSWQRCYVTREEMARVLSALKFR